MPCPVLMYQLPDGVTPAAFHSSSSLAFVPDSSARDANGAFVSAIRRNASIVGAPATCAGSEGGPTSTKSLLITYLRLAEWPPATNSRSAAGECTSSTSASPRAPRASACPEPTATVLTVQSELR